MRISMTLMDSWLDAPALHVVLGSPLSQPLSWHQDRHGKAGMVWMTWIPTFTCFEPIMCWDHSVNWKVLHEAKIYVFFDPSRNLVEFDTSHVAEICHDQSGMYAVKCRNYLIRYSAKLSKSILDILHFIKPLPNGQQQIDLRTTGK